MPDRLPAELPQSVAGIARVAAEDRDRKCCEGENRKETCFPLKHECPSDEG